MSTEEEVRQLVTALKNNPDIQAQLKRLAPLLFLGPALMATGLLIGLFAGSDAKGLKFTALALDSAGVGILAWLFNKTRHLLDERSFENYQKWIEIKHNIVSALPSVDHFKPTPGFPEKVYNQSLLFPGTKANVKNAQDSINGTHNGVPYRLIELKVGNRTQKRKQSWLRWRTVTTYTKIFHGLLFACEFNKRFNSTTLLTTDRSEKTFGAWARSTQRVLAMGSELKLVELENPEFEELFLIRSSDPIEARYLLSSSLMEKIVALKKAKKCEIQLCFQDGKLLVAIPSETKFLDSHRYVENPDEQKELMRGDLQSVVSIIEALDIDEKIWASGRSRGNFL